MYTAQTRWFVTSMERADLIRRAEALGSRPAARWTLGGFVSRLLSPVKGPTQAAECCACC